MTEREKSDFNLGDKNNEHGTWKENSAPSQQKQQPKLVPMPAKPVASVLSIWSARQRNKASSSHMEFAGRMSYGNRAELYTTLKSNTRWDDVMVGTKWNGRH